MTKKEYVNVNVCKTFVVTGDFPDQACSEVTVINRSGSDSEIRTEPGGDPFLLMNDESFVFRGVTNSNQLSATATPLTIRTQYYSNSPSR